MKNIKKILILILSINIIISGCQNYRGEIVSETDEKITLTVLAGQSTSDAGIEDMIDEVIEREFPHVKLEWECVDWGEKFDSQIRGRFAAGDSPDIMIGKAQDAISYASTGNLAAISSACLEGINEGALNAVTVNGTIYGMPYNALYQGVIYNKGIFQKYNLKVPTTQEELIQIVEILQQQGVTPFACHLQESWKLGNMTMQFLTNEVFRYDPSWGDKFRSGETSFAAFEPAIQCLTYSKDILEATWQDVFTINQFESDSRFAQGQAAMYVTGSWSIQFLSEYSNSIEVGIFPYPNANGDAHLIQETNLTFMKSAQTVHSDLIDQIFTTLIADEKLASEILDFTQTSSVIDGIEPTYQSVLQNDIDYYESTGQLIDVTIGNSQLVWSFQNDLAAKQLLWLQDEETLENLLQYADTHRKESAYY